MKRLNTDSTRKQLKAYYHHELDLAVVGENRFIIKLCYRRCLVIQRFLSIKRIRKYLYTSFVKRQHKNFETF